MTKRRAARRSSGECTGDDATSSLDVRIGRSDWDACRRALSDRGYARLPGLLTSRECELAAGWFDEPDRFRKTIEMGAHAYGRGCYRYFAYPLPPLVTTLRRALYASLQSIANGWQELLGIDERFPATLDELLDACHARGQRRPTPLLLRYEAEGYNRMHQDVYGDVAFPLQATVLLSEPGDDFEGGEFLISEGRARMQTRTEAIRLERGEGIVIANTIRPVPSARGHARASMRHGVSRIHHGQRLALGIIFHDAE